MDLIEIDLTDSISDDEKETIYLKKDIICGEYKLKREDNIWGTQIRIYKGNEFMFFGENDLNLQRFELRWDPNKEFSKEKAIKSILDEFSNLESILNKRVFSYAGKKNISLNWRDDDSPKTKTYEFEFTDSESAIRTIVMHEKYNKISSFFETVYETSVGLQIFEKPWSTEHSSVVISTENPQFDWILDLFYKTSDFRKENEAENILKMLSHEQKKIQ